MASKRRAKTQPKSGTRGKRAGKKTAAEKGTKKSRQATAKRSGRTRALGVSPKRGARAKAVSPKRGARATKKLGVKKSAAKKSGVKKSGVKKSAAKKPVVVEKKSTVKKTNVKSVVKKIEKVTPSKAKPGILKRKKSTKELKKATVASLLVRMHGIDKALAPKIAHAFREDIEEWRREGLTSVDIAILISQSLAEEGVTFQGSRIKPEKVTLVEQTEVLKAQLIDMRATLLKSKYDKGYSPPSRDTWMRLDDSGEFTGYSRYIPFHEFLESENLPEIIRETVAVARELHAQHPEGHLYTAIEIFYYGQEIVGSKKASYYRTPLGEFGRAMSGTKGVSTVALFERAIRRRLRKLSLSPNATALLESVTVKTYEPEKK